MSQRPDRVDLRSPASGEITGKHRGAHQHSRDADEGQWIGRTNAIKQAGKKAAQSQRTHQTDGHCG
jgi:hypothetical protein